ncbi:hypothetical protein AGMMS50249_3420 [candidate division SR1 bacterium]|nr:hypothetical protein AGMMS50249_3420 [candidate division SR1 bacterium]
MTKKPDYNYLSQKLEINNAIKLQQYLEKKSKGVNFPTLGRDVAPFLFDPNNQSVALFPQIIQQTKWE